MAWQELILRLAAEDLPQAEALLELAGAAALSLADGAECPLLEPAPDETPLWPHVVVRALFAQGVDVDKVGALLSAATGAACEVRAIEDADWVEAWRERIPAREFGGGFWVLPADAPPQPAQRALRLHMGLAFGTGRHTTTALCVEWLATQPLAGTTVLDFGCGSGILALAALELGAAYAWAVDHDDQALAATRDNALLNDLGERVWVGRPDALPPVHADVVVANIVAGTLTALAARLAACAKAHATIVLSGILTHLRDDVESAYSTHFEAFDCVERDGWIRLVARRRVNR